MTKQNAFATAFLEALSKQDCAEYPTSLEAGKWSGPWSVSKRADGWHVIREGSTQSEAVLELKETACMLAAVFPLAFQ